MKFFLCVGFLHSHPTKQLGIAWDLIRNSPPLHCCCSLDEAPKSSSSKKLGLLGWSSLCDPRAPVFPKAEGITAPKRFPSQWNPLGLSVYSEYS